MDIVDWCEKFRMLSPSASNEPGLWRSSRSPYAAAVMRACMDPTTPEVVIMGSSQSGKSEILLNLIAYRAANDPGPSLLLVDNLISCKTMSEDRLQPMFRDSPILAGLVNLEKGPSAESTTYKFSYPGGNVHLVGSNSSSGVSMRPIRFLYIDEADRCAPETSSKEGDPVGLARLRLSTFPNRKVLMVSSPTIGGASRIESAFNASTQEHWHLPCPSCGHYQRLVWSQIDRTTARMSCFNCREASSQASWQRGIGVWRSALTNVPELASINGGDDPVLPRIRGFHIPCWISHFLRWDELIEEHLEATRLMEESDHSKLKVFVTGRLAEPWITPSIQIAEHELLNRREIYSAELPSPVKAILASIDTQDSSLEFLIGGMCDRNEFYLLERGSILGDLGRDFAEMYAEVDARIIHRVWETAEGRLMRIVSAVQDSGGHHSEAVMRAARERQRYLMTYRGGPSIGNRPLFMSQRPSKDDGGVFKLYGASDLGKDMVFARLANPPPGPGTIHIPLPDQWHHGFDQEFCEEVTAEKKEITWRDGRRIVRWKKKKSGGHNESLDLLVMLMILHESKQTRPIEKLPAMYLPEGTLRDPETGGVKAVQKPEAPMREESPLTGSNGFRVQRPGRRYRPSIWGKGGIRDV
jgi:phage terminase large subunit GpA-like protein